MYLVDVRSVLLINIFYAPCFYKSYRNILSKSKSIDCYYKGHIQN